MGGIIAVRLILLQIFVQQVTDNYRISVLRKRLLFLGQRSPSPPRNCCPLFPICVCTIKLIV